MPPKGKGKKGRKQDEDDFWDKAGESVASVPASSPPLDDEEDAKSKGGFSSFAGLAQDGADVEEEDFGGIMSAIKASSNKQKDKKKSKKGKAGDGPDVSFLDGPPPGAGSDGEAAAAKGDISAPAPPIQMTADDLADEEWGPINQKGKKNKKGGKSKASATTDEAGVEPPSTTVGTTADDKVDAATKPTEVAKSAAGPAGETEEGDDPEEEAPGASLLSKKEKERLKKEREKAKKKAQAEAKKATTAVNESAGAPQPAVSAPAEEAKEDDDDDEADEAGGDKKKSKKKKKKKVAEVKEEEAKKEPAKKGKAAAAIAALRAAQEAQRAALEEAKRKEEEERKRLEEEERQRQEEERLKEEAKQRRKEKEKAKIELAKKEGRLLTKKQKEEKAAAEARMRSLIESGVQIAGLQGGGATGVKKVVYGNRKKKGPAQASKSGITEEQLASPATPASTVPDLPGVQPTISTGPSNATSDDVEGEDVKESWDATDDEPRMLEEEAADVKDSWDASSDDDQEERETKNTVTAPTANGKTATNGTPSVSGKPTKPVDAIKAGKTQALSAAPADALPTTQLESPTTTQAVSSDAPQSANGSAQRTPAPPTAAEQKEDDASEDSGSDSESEDDSEVDLEESSEDGMTTAQRIAAQRKAEAAERRAKRHEEALAARNKDDLRSPICCILGHVDTGKTKLLDKIRQTNVQEGEAGGITQQIGATYFPVDAIKQKTLVLNQDGSQEYKIPGLLVIDTPGHESFTNLRTRGSSLCNIAILVVDIMHGLEPQTLESLRLLRDKKTPFVVALNKIDRLYGWVPTPDGAFRESLGKQKPAVQREFEDRVQKTIIAFAEQGLNSVLYYDNKRFDRNVSLVPTSAITGEGIPDMIMLLVNLTQQRMSDRLMYLSELECTVLEVKVIEGLGTTIDVVLSNGILHEGDRIVVCGLDGPISTQVRALLTPQPLRELRIKSVYVHHKEVKAALGVKITAPGLEKAIAGSRLLVVGPDDDEDDLRDEVMSDLTNLLSNIDKSGRGVCVQASTLGSLEALLDFLKSSKIPVSGINIGPIHKKDIMRAATMLERARELACILCFDVQVDKEAEKLAEELGVRLFKADIIYHLFDAFTAYNAEMMEARRRDAAPQAIWPCRLKIIAVFAKRDPIILGVDILDGTLRVGTPLCVVKVDPTTQKKEIIPLGKITSLEINHKNMDIVKKSQAGGGVAVKIEHAVYQSAKMYGRHFDDKDELLSHITRTSIDVLKDTFRADVSKEEWLLIKGLKQRLDIQ